MVDLLSKPLNITIGVLQRYNAGQVDLYTSVVGQAICANFRLGAVGRKRLDEALSSLSTIGSYGDVLCFGFGVEDLVRLLVKTEEGAVCVALCAALRECYHEDFAVEILLELARLTSVPGKYMPSSLEWKGLLNACSGTLATTTFPLQAEQFMSLLRTQERPTFDVSPSTVRSCSTPETIAQALFAMARITRNEIKAITIIGGADAGWLAALGQWLFDCKIKLALMDGTIVYQNVQEESQIQLEFISSPAGRNINGLSLTDQRLEFCNRTYVLHDASVLFAKEGRNIDEEVVSGRVKWEHALSVTFMADFRNLIRIPHIFGKVIGSAARIFKAVANSDENIPLKYRVACTTYCTESYGPGFVQNTISWFPELTSLGTHMEKASVMSLEDAFVTYEVGIQNLRMSCQCDICPNAEKPQHETPGRTDRFCLVVMVETIICLSRSLAHMNVAKELYPVRAGFELAYRRQNRMWKPSSNDLEEIGPIVSCLSYDSHLSWDAGSRLFEALAPFTGRSPTQNGWDISAQCVNGICAFLGILKTFSVQAGAVRRIYVLPGRILLEGKNYLTLEDDSPLSSRREGFSDTLAQRKSTESDSTLKLRVKEASNALRCLLEVSASRGERSSLSLLVGVEKLDDMLINARGWVTCKQNGKCEKLVGDIPDNSKEEIKYGGIYLSAVNAQSNEQAITVLRAASFRTRDVTLFVIDKECHDCCVRSALRIDKPEGHRFWFLRTAL